VRLPRGPDPAGAGLDAGRRPRVAVPPLEGAAPPLEALPHLQPALRARVRAPVRAPPSRLGAFVLPLGGRVRAVAARSGDVSPPVAASSLGHGPRGPLPQCFLATDDDPCPL